jgi:hypothetical protein
MMANQADNQTDSVLRITAEEVNSPHVDELLLRQRNLRGEAGTVREIRRRWYYSNWFIFMLAGGIAALLAAIAIEPFFDDTHYCQGQIHTIIRLDRSDMLELALTGDAFIINIGDENVLAVDDFTKMRGKDGETGPLSINELAVGQIIGAHAEHVPTEDDELYVAHVLDLAPPDPAPSKAAMSLHQQAMRSLAAGLLLFPVVAAAVGCAIGAAEGIVCRLARRALLGAAVGLLVGFIGGLVSGVIANVVYSPLSALAMAQEGDAIAGLSRFGFVVQMTGRALAWCLAGTAMGLAPGIVLRSRRLVFYGLLGGLVGGLVGGLLFDPIDFLLVGIDAPSSHVSRLVGLTLIGAVVGIMIGVVELLARDAWLRMVEGPLSGKEFLLFRDSMRLGASPRSDVYLFNDPDVAAQHAIVRTVGDNHELENTCVERPTRVNGRPVRRCYLRHGDEISIGSTVFVFQKRQG